MQDKQKLLDITKQLFDDISYDINTVWDDSYEDVSNITDMIKSILSYFNNDKEVKNELILVIQYYVYRLYEEVN